MNLESLIRDIVDFPEKGIIFKDITPLIQSPEGLRKSIELMQKDLEGLDFDVIVSPEARGFLFGVPIAYNLNKGFIPVRKPGKLPYKKISEEYDLEYGSSIIEMHKDAIKPGQRVVIIDDLLATGGTTKAMVNLIERMGGQVVKIQCLVELEFLNGRELIKGYDISSLIKY